MALKHEVIHQNHLSKT